MIEQRKFKRFELKLPLEVVRAGSRKVAYKGETRNVSSGGVLFVSELSAGVGEAVEYLITLPGDPSHADMVSLRCMGKVVRYETGNPGAPGNVPRSVAVTLERYEFVRSATSDNGVAKKQTA